MKHITVRTVLLLLVLSSILTACKKDFLNTKPVDQVPGSDTWKDPALSEAFVFGLYGGLGVGGFEEQMMASVSDEAIFTHAGRGINTINEGTLNESNLGWQSSNFEWTNMYNRIRPANIALQNLPGAAFDDKTLKERLQGEARFLRAYYYQQLLRFYGAIPIVTQVYGLDQDYTVASNTYAECVNFIVKDLDTAALLLKGKSKIRGRASDVAALALKSRVLIYAASDLHDMPTAKAKSPLLAAYAKPELLGYVSGDRTSRWQAAKDAAKAAMDAAGTGYKTDLSAPVSFEDARKNYTALAMGGGSKSPDADPAAAVELLFERTFSKDLNEGAGQVGLYNGPNGYHNWSGNSPIGELVDDYEMMDGTKFSWSDPEKKANPYNNREARFYVTILYDGASWKPRDKISGNVDPANQIQTGTYKIGSNVLPGLDTRQSSIENWNGSWTGYYFRKFTDPDPNIIENTQRQYIPWGFLKYTELMFNYAEACIELGLDAEARTWINKIRFRAGLPAATESGDALRQRLRSEKRIEMAYEEQRYHDARRWMIAPTTLGRTTTYIDVQANLKAGATAPVPYRKDPTKFDYTYTPVPTTSLENRKWDDKMYYRPLNKDEIFRNSKLINNPGYK
ncbi:MAG: RagB/SusD family nutrient uptake outer membrane protein [Bacteroidota bacterium]|nr:RagB/SusD family nutrient uptake outer membrane protein [Bacteroidota bacterium]